MVLGWPDTTEGLLALKKRFILGTLSNGSARLLVDMVRSPHYVFLFQSDMNVFSRQGMRTFPGTSFSPATFSDRTNRTPVPTPHCSSST